MKNKNRQKVVRRAGKNPTNCQHEHVETRWEPQRDDQGVWIDVILCFIICRKCGAVVQGGEFRLTTI